MSDDSRQTVTAFFEDRAEADRAKADLLAAGFPEADIRVLEGRDAQAEVEPHKEVGFFRSLLDIFVFMPEDDKATYEEALKRGGFAVAVHTGSGGYERAIDILDRDGAVNLDERETTWATEGWSKPAPSAGDRFAAAGDPLDDPNADPDVRRRLGTGTADPGVGLDLAPDSAVAPGPERTPIPGEGEQSITARRDTEHGRGRVRSYLGTVAGIPTGVDPSI